jgi:hypothetical protein
MLYLRLFKKLENKVIESIIFLQKMNAEAKYIPIDKFRQILISQ